MVLCFIALPIFAVLAIFSAKYRRLTKDSLDCLFRTATLRKCTSGMDDRIRSQITGKLFKFSPPAGRFFYKNYKLISFIILILFIWSIWISSVAVYNYTVYGHCEGLEGLQNDEFCILNEVFDEQGEVVATYCENETDHEIAVRDFGSVGEG